MFKSVVSASLVAASLAAPSFAATKSASAAPTAAPAASVSAAAPSPSAEAPKARGEHPKRMARHSGPQGRSPERLVQRLEKDLKLTPEQTVKVREILVKDAPVAGAKASPGVPGAKPDGRMARGPLPSGAGFAAQMRADKVDTAALDRAWEQQNAKRREGFVKMRDKFVALHAVLTPEQRAQLAERMERRGKGMRHGKEGGQDKHG